jgi:hypothetical protein
MEPRKHYSDEEKEIVKKYAQTKTAEEIGLIIGRSRMSVQAWCSVNYVKLRKVGENHNMAVLSNLQSQMVLALYNAGFSATEIRKACFSHVTLGCITGITTGKNRG